VVEPGGGRVDRRLARTAGAPREIAATVAERAFYSLEAPVLRVSGFDTPFPPAALETEYLPSADRVLEAVDRSMAY
jgi:2-oxoisovalerate dehydrogenase E1 component beta subunit